MTPITIAITTFNRFDLLIESFEKVMDHPAINEIVISDDASTLVYFNKIMQYAKGKPKICIYHNTTNQGVYRNKYHSVVHATNPWVIVFDSDNVIDKSYIDKLFELYPWNPKTEYCPSRALPDFDYRNISDQPITKENVNSLWKKKQFDAFINTFNSFFNREEYIRVWNGDFEPISSDSIYMNYKWLAAGNNIQIVQGLEYYHRIHKDSHYVNNCGKSMAIHKDVEQKIRQLK